MKTTRRIWTADEIKIVKQSRKDGVSWTTVAEFLGRSRPSVYQQVQLLGLANKRPARRGFKSFIRRHHKLGWSDHEIAAAWNCQHPGQRVSREWLCEVRREKLRLAHNAFSQHRRQQVAKKTKQQLRRCGCASLAEVRSKAFGDFAVRQGWPADIRPRGVQILTLLYQQGPHTRRQICDKIGMRWKGSRQSLTSNDREGSYLAHLIARGLVVQLPRMVKGRGRGKSVHLYAIAPQIHRGETCEKTPA
jgi:hypothetical protein